MRDLRKELRKKILDKEYRRDDEGRIVVDMYVKDDEDFLSEFSSNDAYVIDGAVAEFLAERTHAVPSGEPLALHIKSRCIDETEERLYTAAIKEYYTEKYRATRKELKIQNRIALVLGVLGVIVLAFAVWLEYRFDSLIWSEVIDIAAWVFLWEAVDIKCFKTRELSMLRKRYAALMSMKVEYENV